MFTSGHNETTQVVRKSSAGIPRVVDDLPEELEPLIPADPDATLNLRAYSEFMERLYTDAIKGK